LFYKTNTVVNSLSLVEGLHVTRVIIHIYIQLDMRSALRRRCAQHPLAQPTTT
jgi:hypothetical protein